MLATIAAFSDRLVSLGDTLNPYSTKDVLQVQDL
jgi:hypothetical protein